MAHDGQRRLNQEARWEVVAAIDRVLHDPERLFRLCRANPAGHDELRDAVRAEYGFNELEADAVLQLQIRRLTPASAAATRAELLDVERWLAEHPAP